MLECFDELRSEKTYDLPVQTSIVRSLEDSIVEIIGVAFVTVLEFVEEVEKLEGEGSCWPNDRCGEPVRMKELEMMRDTTRYTAVTVSNDDAVNTIQVEDHQVVVVRGGGARVTWVVTELNHATELGEGGRFIEPSVPLLQ